jgi:hypothetical protein
MFIYNVTIKVSWQVHDAWLAWMKNEHLQDVVDTGCFVKSGLLLLHEVDDSDGPTYAAQFHASSKQEYERYIATYAVELRKKTTAKWGEHVVAFRSLMEVVQ